MHGSYWELGFFKDPDKFSFAVGNTFSGFLRGKKYRKISVIIICTKKEIIKEKKEEEEKYNIF